MKNLFISSLCLFFFINCSKVDLIEASSEEINQYISKYRGNDAVLLNVWATSCAPCVEEFPMIVKLDNEIIDLKVLFISTDFDDEKHKVKKFLDLQNVNGISFIKNEKDDLFINGLHPKWSGALPFSIIYGKKTGKIVDYWEGKEPELKFRESIQIALSN